MDADSREQRFRRSSFRVMRTAEETRDLALATASALAELAMLCEDIATQQDPPDDQHYRDLAQRLRDSSRRRMRFVEWETDEIHRLFGTDPPPRP